MKADPVQCPNEQKTQYLERLRSNQGSEGFKGSGQWDTCLTAYPWEGSRGVKIQNVSTDGGVISLSYAS